MSTASNADEEEWNDWKAPANLLDCIEGHLWKMGTDIVEVPVTFEDGSQGRYPYAYVDAGELDVLGCILLLRLREVLHKAGLDVPLEGEWERLADEWHAGAEEREAAAALAAARAAEQRARLSALVDLPVPAPVQKRADMRETALYRWYDEADVLLYVGISANLRGRTQGHARGSTWMEFAARSTVERYPNRAAALDAEETAIKTEQPLFNSTHNCSAEARHRAVTYLIEHGGDPEMLVPRISRG